MRTYLHTTAAVLVLLCCSACALAAIEVRVADDDVLFERTGADGGVIGTWGWGVVMRPADAPALLDLDDLAFGVEVSEGLRTYGPRDSEGRAPLTFITGGTVLVVDGDVDIETVGGHTVISAPKKDIDPRAGLIMFLGLLILTGVMMRNTRRSMARR